MPNGLPGLPLSKDEVRKNRRAYFVILAVVAFFGLLFYVQTRGGPSEVGVAELKKTREGRIALLRHAERSDFVRFEDGTLCLVEMSRQDSDLRCNKPPGTTTGETRIDIPIYPTRHLPVELIKAGMPRYKEAAEAYALRKKLNGPTTSEKR